jgi:hypothetical protein
LESMCRKTDILRGEVGEMLLVCGYSSCASYEALPCVMR